MQDASSQDAAAIVDIMADESGAQPLAVVPAAAQRLRPKLAGAKLGAALRKAGDTTDECETLTKRLEFAGEVRAFSERKRVRGVDEHEACNSELDKMKHTQAFALRRLHVT